MGRTGQEGFTLIELMIVVAIIGILAGVAIPQFSSMVRKSQEATTRGNLGVLRSALSIYYADNEGVFPRDNLDSLSAGQKYLQGVPWKNTPPYHPPGQVVGVGSMSGIILNKGDWYYDNDDTETTFGNVFVNCVHADLKGASWTSY